MTETDNSFLALATRGQIVRSACKVALLVGTILVLINHGVAIAGGTVGADNLLQIALTYLVPYCVSTYSAVRAIQGQVAEPG